jgi:Na+-transporting methylmalonyl-CoA/oxaloacetate decarboxylase gamma subunit
MRIRRTALIMLLVAAAAAVTYGEPPELVSFQPGWTLSELAASESIPVKRLADQLGLELRQVGDRSLADLDVTRDEARDAVAAYRESESGFVAGIVGVGMMIVFLSLLVVALLISLFKHMHLFDRPRKARTRSVQSVVGTITSSGDLSEYSIAAVIAAIFLHEDEVDSGNRLLLTWRRASTSAWRTGASMPNDLHSAARSSRR